MRSIKQFYNIDIIQGDIQNVIYIGAQIEMKIVKRIGQNLPNKNASSLYVNQTDLYSKLEGYSKIFPIR